MQSTYPLARVAARKGPGKRPHLDDGVFRSHIVSIASCGMSRRGVARRAGIPPSTLQDWLDRGRAHPDEEPYGSFTVDYLRAESGLEHAIAETAALWVQRLREMAAQGAVVDSRAIAQLLQLQRARYPEDYGTHAHRRPEQEPSGDAWLERNGITHAQLVHMLREPPESVSRALVEAGDSVMALLIAGGVRVPG